MPAPTGTESYSRYTQTMVGAWRQLAEPRQLGPTSVPWVVIWGAATAGLLALEAVRPPVGAWLAGIILTGFALNVVIAGRK